MSPLVSKGAKNILKFRPKKYGLFGAGLDRTVIVADPQRRVGKWPGKLSSPRKKGWNLRFTSA